jgi:hypothetical protein
MCQELISISFESLPTVPPLFFTYSDILQEALPEDSAIANDPFPMMKFFVITEQLAPFNDACVDEVTIDRRPELALLLGWKKLPLNMVVGKIPR